MIIFRHLAPPITPSATFVLPQGRPHLKIIIEITLPSIIIQIKTSIKISDGCSTVEWDGMDGVWVE